MSRPRHAIVVVTADEDDARLVTDVLAALGAFSVRDGGPSPPSLGARLLASLGFAWTDWGRLPDDWRAKLMVAPEAARVRAEFRGSLGTADLVALAAPELVRLLPLWQEMLGEAGIAASAVLPVGHPIAFAEALSERYGLPHAAGYLVWLRTSLEAEFGSRAMPRCVVSRDALLEGGRLPTYRLIEALPVAWPSKSGASLDDIARRLAAEPRRAFAAREELALRPDLKDDVKATWDALETLRVDPRDASAMARLDGIRQKFDEACDLLFPAFKAAQRLAESERGRVALLERRWAQEWEALSGELADLRDEFDARRLGLAAFAERLHPPDLAHISDADVPPSPQQMRLARQAKRELRQYRRRYGGLIGLGRRLLSPAGRRRTCRDILASGLFDSRWYRQRYMAGSSADLPPVEHFLAQGSKANHDPGPDFQSAWYIEHYGDVRESGLNPLMHYLAHGRNEGRMTSDPRLPVSP